MRNNEIESWVAGVARCTKPSALRRPTPTAIGQITRDIDLDLAGLGIRQAEVDALVSVDPRAWLAELQHNETVLAKFPGGLRSATWSVHRSLRDGLGASIS